MDKTKELEELKLDSPVLIDRVQFLMSSPEIFRYDRGELTKSFRESVSPYLVKKNGRISGFKNPVLNAKMSGKPRVWFDPSYFSSSAEVVSVQAYGSFSMLVTYNIIGIIKKKKGIDVNRDIMIKDDNYLHYSDVVYTSLFSKVKNFLDGLNVLDFVPSSVSMYQQFSSEFLGVDLERVRESVSQVEFCRDWYVGNSISYIRSFFNYLNRSEVEFYLKHYGLVSYHYGKFSNPKTLDLPSIYLDFSCCQMKFYPKTIHHLRQEIVFRKNQHIKKISRSLSSYILSDLMKYANQYFNIISPLRIPFCDVPRFQDIFVNLFPDTDFGLIIKLLRGEVVYSSDFPQIYKKRWRKLLVPVSKNGRKRGYMLKFFKNSL